jgi:hypothetical protein
MQQEDTPLTAASGGILNGPMKYKFAPSEPSNQNINPSSSAPMCWNMQQSLLPSLVAIIISSLTKNPYTTLTPHSISTVTTPREKHGQKRLQNCSAIGCALSQIQAALMIGNPTVYTMDHISTTYNVVADDISCIPCESHTHTEFLKLCTQYHMIIGCDHYQPNPVLIYLLVVALLQSECVKPLDLSRLLLTNHGRFIS